MFLSQVLPTHGAGPGALHWVLLLVFRLLETDGGGR